MAITSFFITFYQNKLQFYNSLLLNFPSISNSFNLKLPVSKFDISSLIGPDVIEFIQTSTTSPIKRVYKLMFDKSALTVEFSARSNPITITLQEYLLGFQWITQFYHQVKLG
jgi:hypothetical protein